LPGGPDLAYAYDISGDGKSIAGEGWSTNNLQHGIGLRWKRTGSAWTVQSFGLPAGPPAALNTPAASLDRNASVYVGRVSFEVQDALVDIDTLAYTWRPSTGLALLPNLGTDLVGAAACASHHGESVFGYGWPKGTPQYRDPYALAWKFTSSSNPSVQRIDPAHEGMALRTERNGRHVVGWGRSPAVGGDAALGREAVCWTRQGASWTTEWLGFLPGFTAGSIVNDISRKNGRFAAGSASDANGLSHPVRWRLANGRKQQTLDLGLPTGMVWAAAGAVNENGRRVVGTCSNGGDDFEVFVWDAGVGLRLLRDFLPNAVAQWKNMSATGLSDNGRVVCGYGEHQPGGPNTATVERAWVATLP